MEIKVTQVDEISLIEILKNGIPANAQNPIDASELADVQWPNANGKMAILSGMPMVAIAAAAMHYKNVFSVVAIANPREKAAEVAHSVSRDYRLGQKLPLPSLV